MAKKTFSLFVLILTLFVSSEVLAGFCIVTSEVDDADRRGTLRFIVERTYGIDPDNEDGNAQQGDHNCRPPEPANNAPGDHLYADASILFAHPNLPSNGQVEDVVLTSPLTFNRPNNDVMIGNRSFGADHDPSADIDYSPAYKAQSAAQQGDLRNRGTVVIDARGIPANSRPFVCGAQQNQRVCLRNVFVKTNGLTQDELFEGARCLCDGGGLIVDADGDGDHDQGDDDPRGDDIDGDGFCGEGVAQCNNLEDTNGDGVIDDNDNNPIPGDCNDNNRAINPNATEICGNDVDENCNGQRNEGCNNGDPRDDLDGDGHCAGAVCLDKNGDGIPDSVPGDCRDDNRLIYPTAPELCDGIDNNCNGQVDEGCDGGAMDDHDRDGYCADLNQCLDINGDGIRDSQPGDCRDDHRLIYPGANEICDLLDNDCDGIADEGCQGTDGDDLDNDGFCASLVRCNDTTGDGIPDAQPGDCRDNNNTIYPNAPELCDGLDNDCDGLIDEDCRDPRGDDPDGDGYCELAVCNDGPDDDNLPDIPGNDCEPNNFDVNPGRTENCTNGIDDNCNGAIDNDDVACQGQGPDGDDLDGDGYCSDNVTVCNLKDDNGDGIPDADQPRPGDCNDRNAQINPAAIERCDDIDNNCNGEIDEGCAGSSKDDNDGDGFCEDPTECNDNDGDGEPDSQPGDCDDSNANINPNATEICSDRVDNNCNQQVDEGCTGPVDPNDGLDLDGDGFCASTTACRDLDGDGQPDARTGDCNDGNNSIHPDAQEICDDNIDNNCDGVECTFNPNPNPTPTLSPGTFSGGVFKGGCGLTRNAPASNRSIGYLILLLLVPALLLMGRAWAMDRKS